MTHGKNLPLPSPLGRHVAFGGLLLLATGCYGAAPPRPAPVAVPNLSANGSLEVYSNSTTAFENVTKVSRTCPTKGDTTNCIETQYVVKEPVTRTVSTATYAGNPVDYAQFRVISDPTYQESLGLLAEHSEACQEANLPRWIGLGLAVAGGLTYSIGASKGSGITKGIGGVALLGAIGSYSAGYFVFGGNRCVEAGRIYDRINYARYSGLAKVHNAVNALEMKTLADQFNQRAYGASRMAAPQRATKPRVKPATKSRAQKRRRRRVRRHRSSAP